jgi:hypothetical protein
VAATEVRRLAAGARISGSSGSVGPASAMRRSAGGGPPTRANATAGVGAAAVVSFDQPVIAGAGLFGNCATAAGGGQKVVNLARGARTQDQSFKRPTERNVAVMTLRGSSASGGKPVVPRSPNIPAVFNAAAITGRGS